MKVIEYRSHIVHNQIAATALPELLCNTSHNTYIICNNRVIYIISYHKHTKTMESYHICNNSVITSIHL